MIKYGTEVTHVIEGDKTKCGQHATKTMKTAKKETKDTIPCPNCNSCSEPSTVTEDE